MGDDNYNDSDGTKSQPFSFRVHNTRQSPMELGIEPWGFYWNLAPGEELEIAFEEATSFWCADSINYTEKGITFWGVYPIAVYEFDEDGKHELMHGDD